MELKLELTQVEGFGVGIFLRSVILEREVITITYRPKGQVDGRGGEKLVQAVQRHLFQNYIPSYQYLINLYFQKQLHYFCEV